MGSGKLRRLIEGTYDCGNDFSIQNLLWELCLQKTLCCPVSSALAHRVSNQALQRGLQSGHCVTQVLQCCEEAGRWDYVSQFEVLCAVTQLPRVICLSLDSTHSSDVWES